jgi:transcriptional regulator with XRE-family HTH domain
MAKIEEKKEELRRLRKELGLSIEKITSKMDTSYHTWYNWESGNCRVPGHVLFCIRLLIAEKKKLIAEELIKEKRNKLIEELLENVRLDIHDLFV